MTTNTVGRTMTRIRSLTERFKKAEGEPSPDHAMAYQQLQREALEAEREAVIGLRKPRGDQR